MDKNRDRNIYFDNLPPLEQEKIATKLEKDILSVGEEYSCESLPFCRYVVDIFKKNALSVVPTVLFDNLLKVEEFYEKCNVEMSDTLFFSDEWDGKVLEYIEYIKKDMKVPDEMFEPNIMGIACLEYIHKEILFMPAYLYKTIAQAFQEDDDIDFYATRMPFVFCQRNLIKYIIRVCKKISKPDYKKWGSVIFDKKAYGLTDANLNKEIFEVIYHAEFDIVNPAFYE